MAKLVLLALAETVGTRLGTAGVKAEVIADSGPGEEDKNGLIVPRFGNKPENHVAVSMSLESLYELLLLTEIHYMAWLTTWYMKHPLDNVKQYHEKANGNSPAMPQVF